MKTQVLQLLLCKYDVPFATGKSSALYVAVINILCSY